MPLKNLLSRYRQSKGHTPWVVWGILIVLSAVFVALLETIHLPAELLLGPMAAAILVAVRGHELTVAPRAFYAAQGIVGCMIASNIPPSIMTEVAKDWPLFFIGVASAIAIASTLGWLLARWQILPGSTAIWGLSPGAASAMTLMAEAYGADMRLVAFMQYLRVVCVAAVASIVAAIWTSGVTVPPTIWFPPIPWVPFTETLLLALVGSIVARYFRIPAGPLLLPLIIGIILSQTGVIRFVLPPWLLAISYAFIGWSIGLRFTRKVISHAIRAFPRVLASTLVLIGACGCFAFLLVRFAGIDPLTAYLATSPGGLDSVAIIAASAAVDLPFVMAMQTVRFLMVLMTSPSIARFIAKRVG